MKERNKNVFDEEILYNNEQDNNDNEEVVEENNGVVDEKLELLRRIDENLEFIASVIEDNQQNFIDIKNDITQYLPYLQNIVDVHNIIISSEKFVTEQLEIVNTQLKYGKSHNDLERYEQEIEEIEDEYTRQHNK